jgi:hypothetical protein
MERTMTEQEQRRWERILIFADWDWDNPEEVYDQWIRQDRETVSKYLDSIFEDCDDKKIRTLYFNYEFFENQILRFVASDCFAYEKTHWILKQYFESLVGGVPDSIPDDYEGSRRTYHPEFGTTDDWMDFIATIHNLYHDGPTEKNLRGLRRMQILHDEYINR